MKKETIRILEEMRNEDLFALQSITDKDKMNELMVKIDALDDAIKALENSSHIIDALEKLKDETLDGIVKFGIEKSIECVRKIQEETT